MRGIYFLHERVQSSGSKDRMAELAAKLADIEIELMAKRTEALSAMRKIGRVIASVENPDFRRLLLQQKNSQTTLCTVILMRISRFS